MVNKAISLAEKFKKLQKVNQKPPTDNEVRDRSKSNRFFTMLNAGGLPEAVLSAWQSAGTRKKQTEIINGVFHRKGGKLVIDQSFLLASTYQKDRITI